MLLTKLAGYGAMIVPPKYIQEKGEENFNTHPVGTGPFKFESYQPKVNVTLARNDDYWGDVYKRQPLMCLTGPDADGWMSKSKISVGSHRVAQESGMSTCLLYTSRCV